MMKLSTMPAPFITSAATLLHLLLLYYICFYFITSAPFMTSAFTLLHLLLLYSRTPPNKIPHRAGQVAHSHSFPHGSSANTRQANTPTAAEPNSCDVFAGLRPSTDTRLCELLGMKSLGQMQVTAFPGRISLKCLLLKLPLIACS